MTVTLSKRTDEIIQARLRTGRYSAPDEVVNHLIEEQLAGARLPRAGSTLSAQAGSLGSVGGRAAQLHRSG